MKADLSVMRLAMLCAAGLVGSVAAAEDMTDQQINTMIDGAEHALSVAGQCQSIFLRDPPLPTTDARVTAISVTDGVTDMTLEMDAPYRDQPSEMELSMTQDGTQTSIECRGTIRLFEGTATDVYGALHRQSEDVGVVLYKANLGPTPNVVSLETCIGDYPTRGTAFSFSMSFARPTQDDEITFSTGGLSGEWGHGSCLVLR